MTALTRFVLRHKALVVLFWLAVTAAGIMTVGATTHRMTSNFAMPGPAFRTDSQIVRQYGNGGSQAPYVPVLDRTGRPASPTPGGRRGRPAGPSPPRPGSVPGWRTTRAPATGPS